MTGKTTLLLHQRSRLSRTWYKAARVAYAFRMAQREAIAKNMERKST